MKALDFRWAEELVFFAAIAFGVYVAQGLMATNWGGSVNDLREVGLALLAGGARAALMVVCSGLLALRSKFSQPTDGGLA